MPFILEAMMERQLAIWAVSEKGAPGIIIGGGGALESAKLWPDILGHGAGWPPFFVSEHVIRSLDRAGIPYARLTKMPVAEVNPARLQSAPPDYYVLEADQGIAVDYAASGVPVDREGKPIPHLYPRKVARKFDLNSWTGADLFSSPNIWKRPTCSLMCTERIVELAKADSWSNVKFEPISVV